MAAVATSLPRIRQSTSASKALLPFSDDDDLPIAHSLLLSTSAFRFDPPSHLFGGGSPEDKASLVRQVRELARQHIGQAQRLKDLQSLKLERERDAAHRALIRRCKEWIREMYMEDWIRSRNIKTKYRFTVKQKAELKGWFELLDSDKSGEVSVNELEDPLLSVGLVTSKQEVVDLIDMVDQDGSGAIGFEEFLQVVFEAGRKSVKEAEERERRRQEKIAMDPLQARRELAKKAAMAAKASAQQQLQAASVRPDLMTVATCSRPPVAHMTLGPIEMMEAGITMTGPANQFGGKTLARTLASTMLSSFDNKRKDKSSSDSADDSSEVNPIVRLQKYHSQTGLADFNSSINIRRRQLLMAAIRALTTNEQELNAIQEKIRTLRGKDRLYLAQLRKKHAKLSKLGNAHKVYVQNMTRILRERSGVATSEDTDLMIAAGLLRFDVKDFRARRPSRDNEEEAEAGSGPPTLKIKVADDDDELSDHEGEEDWYGRSKLKVKTVAFRIPNTTTSSLR